MGGAWDYLKVRKKWWLTPIVLAALLLGLLLLTANDSPGSPFVYTLF